MPCSVVGTTDIVQAESGSGRHAVPEWIGGIDLQRVAIASAVKVLKRERVGAPGSVEVDDHLVQEVGVVILCVQLECVVGHGQVQTYG